MPSPAVGAGRLRPQVDLEPARPLRRPRHPPPGFDVADQRQPEAPGRELVDLIANVGDRDAARAVAYRGLSAQDLERGHVAVPNRCIRSSIRRTPSGSFTAPVPTRVRLKV